MGGCVLAAAGVPSTSESPQWLFSFLSKSLANLVLWFLLIKLVTGVTTSPGIRTLKLNGILTMVPALSSAIDKVNGRTVAQHRDPDRGIDGARQPARLG